MPGPETIRTAGVQDVAAGAAVRAAAITDSIITAEGMRLWLDDVPAEADLLLLAAEVGGEVVGWCTAMRNWFQSDHGVGFVDVTVHPAHQGRGIGSRLARRGTAHLDGLGLHTVRASSVDAPAQQAMAKALGFVEGSSSSTSSVDPRTVQPVPVPAGVTLRPFGEIDDPRPIYELDLDVSRDIPGDESMDALTLEQWSSRFWRTVFADDQASMAAYVDGELAAISMLRVDRPSGRAQNNLTATRREFRGRGLARLLKSHSLHVAAEAGATIAFTTNDETNAAMLAVNRALGYRHLTRRVEWERVRSDA